MGEMAALWSYEEPKDMDQLGEKLLSKTLELEKLKSESQNDMQKSKEFTTQLIHLLKSAIQERDEARNQLEKLLTFNKEANISLPNNIYRFESQSNGLVKNPTAKASSSLMESNSLSETYNNYHSNLTSPVESFFESVASPIEFSNVNALTNQAMVQEATNVLVSNGNEMMMSKPDQGSLIIDDLAKGRALPQRGKFVEAVLKSGPLLNTLLIAGPLPRWRNPPQIRAFDCIPNVSLTKNVGQVASYAHNNNDNMSCGSAQVFASSSGSGFGNVCSGLVNDNGCYRLVKRQRLS